MIKSYLKRIQTEFKTTDVEFEKQPNLKLYVKLLSILPHQVSFFIGNLNRGRRHCIEAFYAWKYIMANEYSVASKKCFDYNAFDILYLQMSMAE